MSSICIPSFAPTSQFRPADLHDRDPTVRSSIGLISGIVIGFVLLLAAILGLVLFVKRHKQETDIMPETELESNDIATDPELHQWFESDREYVSEEDDVEGLEAFGFEGTGGEETPFRWV
jgi:hypothetical protein